MADPSTNNSDASIELLQVPPLTRVEINNLVAALDGVLRSAGLAAAETCLQLAAKLTSAKPVAT